MRMPEFCIKCGGVVSGGGACPNCGYEESPRPVTRAESYATPAGPGRERSAYRPVPASASSPTDALNALGAALYARDSAMADEILAGRITLADGEVPVRRYSAGVMLGGQMNIMVSNRRVIVDTQSSYFGMISKGIQEVAIDTVTGISANFSRGIKIPFLLWGLACLIMGLNMMFTNPMFAGPLMTVLGIILTAVGVYLLILCRRPSYVFQVTSTGAGTPVNVSGNMRSVLSGPSGNGLIFTMKPTVEYVRMLNEIGALVLDLKARGDLAVANWSEMED